jgi:hypothetical protein
MKTTDDPTLANSWLFPGKRVSFNNTPFINLSAISNICHYTTSAKENTGYPSDKRKTYYILFNNDASLKWYYQEEKSLMLDKAAIQLLITNGNKKDSI